MVITYVKVMILTTIIKLARQMEALGMVAMVVVAMAAMVVVAI